MTITGEAPSRSDVVPPGELTGSVARRRPAVTLAGSAAVAAGTGLTYLVARAGEPPWQVVRALVVVALTVLVRKLLASGRGLPRSTTAFCAGAIAAPVGLAVAGPHLSKVGANPQSVAGAITAVAGLTLLVIGAVGLVRAARGWWRLPATTALLVLLYVTEPAITAAVAATNVPPTEVDTATPASLGMAYEDVTFPAADGTDTVGLVRRVRERSRGGPAARCRLYPLSRPRPCRRVGRSRLRRAALRRPRPRSQRRPADGLRLVWRRGRPGRRVVPPGGPRC